MQNLLELNNQFVEEIPLMEKAFSECTDDFFPELQDRLDQFSMGLDEEQKSRLQEEYFGVGPLAEIVEDTEINEIVINDYQDIFYEKKGRWYQLQDRFLTGLTYHHFIQRLCHETASNLDQRDPFLCVKWGKFRVHITEASITGSPCISLRRHPDEHWNFRKLLDYDWCGDYSLECIQGLLEEKKNILVVGATGTGKTSFMNACLDYIGVEDRCILLEDTDELHPPNPLSVKLLTRAGGNDKLPAVDLAELIKQSLRMRPDRLVLGEVRGPEAKDLLMAMATGHEGSLASLHANSAQEALLRLEMLIQLGAPHWSLDAIRRLIHLSIDSIVVVGRKHGKRKLAGIWKLVALEKFGIIMQQADA